MEKDKKALSYTLKLISKRWYTTFEIRQKLELKQYSVEDIEKTIKFLEDKKFLDDQRFALSFIKDHQAFRHEGKFVITQKLIKKGISKDDIKTTWQEYETEYGINEIEIAADLVRKKLSTHQSTPDPLLLTPDQRNRLMNFLSRKGFSYDVIKKALAIYRQEG